MISFEFTFSDAFVTEASWHARQCNKTRKFFATLKVVLGVILAALVIFCGSGGFYVPIPIFVGAIVLLMTGHRIDNHLLLRRFHKSPFYGEPYRVELSEAGVNTTGAKSRSQSTWDIFTSARRFKDGFLLFQGPGFFTWLPDVSLRAGSVAEAEAIIQAKVPDYRSV